MVAIALELPSELIQCVHVISNELPGQFVVRLVNDVELALSILSPSIVVAGVLAVQQIAFLCLQKEHPVVLHHLVEHENYVEEDLRANEEDEGAHDVVQSPLGGCEPIVEVLSVRWIAQ